MYNKLKLQYLWKVPKHNVWQKCIFIPQIVPNKYTSSVVMKTDKKKRYQNRMKNKVKIYNW